MNRVLIEWAVENSVAMLTLRRPEKANAYTNAMLDELHGHLQHIWSDDGVRAIVLRGAGKHFCAGADLNEVGARRPLEATHLSSRRLFEDMARGAKPIIAAVQGAALGGGLEMALACDLRLAASDARFGLPETGFGLIPAAGGTVRLPRIIGPARAREMILLGREIDAETALAWGLVNAVVAPDRLPATAREWAAEIARRDPAAIRLARRMLESSDESGLRLEGLSQAILYERRPLGAWKR